MALTGILAGPISGLKYRTPTHSGLTGDNGEFEYEEGERMTFLLGGNALGYVTAGPRIHLAQLVPRVDGDLDKLKDSGLTNIARLIFTLGREEIRDNGTAIPPEVHDIIGTRRINFRHDADYAATGTLDKVTQFTEDPVVIGLLDDLGASGVFGTQKPRTLCTPANARNELRRNALGILRFRDVRIPLQNGSYVLADVFRPAAPGDYPAIVNCGPYGKAFNHHSIATSDDLEHHEVEEEEYFFGNAGDLQFENHETVSTAVWVPDGYAVVRVDMPGAGASPGKLAPWGIVGAEAFRDAIEWAGTQPWSNGNVGTWGMSYLAISQHAAASLHPEHLKAMIAIGTDVDLYEDVAYNGGVLNEQFWPIWRASGLTPPIVGEPDLVDFVQIMKDSPFRDSNPDAIFGPRSEVFMSPDLSDVTVPLWAVAATTHLSNIHQLGSNSAYLNTPTPHKKLDFWEDWFQRAYAAETVAQHKAFFDHWLKGVDNGIMDGPPIRLEIRTGDGTSYLQEEDEWPIARTEYPKWYFDAEPSEWVGDGHRSEFLRLSTTAPVNDAESSYSAQVQLAPRAPIGSPRVDPESAESDPHVTGVSFVSEPLAEDAVIAGFGTVRLWVSSTSDDIDLFVSVRVIGADDQEVDFTGFTTFGFPFRIAPLTKGWLKVSHRALDAEKSTPYQPKHTHLKADYSPLRQGEIVPVDVALVPNVGKIFAGQRIRIDVQPHDGVAHGLTHEYDPGHHDNATNRIHTGPEHSSYVQLPVVPPRPGIDRM
ncbi:hydrolase [Frondihabitans sp. PAMC 28766]|uniref:CocE/NonD family hydrolase n=1 Tax=Frondihabitans sp. PAMC 28766 TaxID=1795630 RepID=UPI00078C5850|nr:CocE/NonD family hydrolase [Frondihabitans sp. PAMC 28766]AMM18941.1 hydrolase [Frondihabitans sp. PAMC 28766]